MARCKSAVYQSKIPKQHQKLYIPHRGFRKSR
nr:MAG TPA: hypothetical protein [Caudoviricetes sp.]DAZ59625.1 MAG TPA: hypothetical protein [Caudoviricetes sp.]